MSRRPILLKIMALALTLLTAASLQAATPKDDRPGKGDVPPTQLGQRLDGSPVTLDLHSGKAYVIAFWASWCAPCVEELPILASIQQIAGPSQMQVITVNIEERQVYKRLESKLKESGLISAFDPDQIARQAYGVVGVPHMVIVGRDGRINSVRIGYGKTTLEGMAQDLNRALAAAPTPAPASSAP